MPISHNRFAAIYFVDSREPENAMTKANILAVKTEAKRLLDKIKEWEDLSAGEKGYRTMFTGGGGGGGGGLTRAMAKMRE